MRQPYCRKCGFTKVRATSSQQMRKVDGQNRLVAEAVCEKCGHSWWSYHPAIKKLARDADAARAAPAVES